MTGAPRFLRSLGSKCADKLGERANSELQFILDGALYQRVFWGTRIPALANVTSEMRYKRNSELIEFVDNKPGSFRNTTVNGQITGFSLDLGVIDDAMKGRAGSQLTMAPWKRDVQLLLNAASILMRSNGQCDQSSCWSITRRQRSEPAKSVSLPCL